MVSSTRKKARGRKFPERGRMGMKMAYNGSVCLSVSHVILFGTKYRKESHLQGL